MLNSFTNWLNNLPVPIPGINPNMSTTTASEQSDAETIEATGEQATSAVPVVVTQQDKPVESAEQLESEANEAADDAKPSQAESEQQKSASDMTAEAAAKIQLEATAALETAKELGNMLFAFGMSATKQLQEKAVQIKDVIEKNSIISDFNKEHEKFVTEKKFQQEREEVAVPPWVGYIDEEQLKKQILALSTDPRNFLRSPPNGVEFNFDFAVAYPVALATLEEDPNLKEMRFNLVPQKIKEKPFWRNYFYRVSLIKQSTQLNSLANDSNGTAAQATSQEQNKPNSVQQSTISEQKQSQRKSESIDNTTTLESGNGALSEFASDQYDDQINEEEIKRDMRQLKLDKELEDTEWDKELQDDIDNITTEELEKEISEMIGNEEIKH